MGFVTDNDLIDGVSGRVGNKIVFRTVKGKTMVTRRPKFTAEPTPAQTAFRAQFKDAAKYAKTKMLDPVVKEVYTRMAGDKPFNSAFTEAVRDYLAAFEVRTIDVSSFSGAAGSIIPVQVSDNDRVVSLKVAIYDNANNLVETGAATYTPGDVYWRYTTQQAIVLPGIKIVATATTRPGKEATLEQLA